MRQKLLLLIIIILLSPIPRAFAQTGQKGTLNGYVYDEYGPITGATIFIKKSTVGTTSDVNGLFTLQDIPYQSTIVVSMIGYENQEFRFRGQKDTIKFELRTQRQFLNEAVVTALGIERNKMALSYNVQEIESDILNKVKDANFVNSLVGKVAGVQISSGAAGQGSATRVVMRGMKSIEKSNTALYVIDGIPMFNTGSTGGEGIFGGGMGSEAAADINPEDIESVSMLTGASAAALYGSDAANGVILITTKKGKAGRTKISYNNNTTFSQILQGPELQSRYGSSTFDSWAGGKVDSDYAPESFFRTGISTINSISVSGGSDKNMVYASASSTNTTSILPGSGYDRYNFTARNTSYLAKDKLVLDFSASYIMQNDENMLGQGRYNSPLPALYLFPRGESFNEMKEFERFDSNLGYMVQYWPYGSGDHDMQNPYWIMKRMIRENKKQRYLLNASVTWNITDWMNISARGRVDNSNINGTTKKYASTLTTFSGENGAYSESMEQLKTFYGDILLNINKTWGDWSLIANVGGSINDQRSKSISASGYLKYPNYFAFNNLIMEQNFSVGQGYWHDQTQSVFASVEAGWKKALYLTVTGRNDWPSQLAFTDRSSFFYPSVGVSGVLSNLISMPQWLNLLKVNASFSQVASAFSRYLSNPGYVYNSQTQTWSKPSTYPAYNLRPEETMSWEAGLTMHMFNTLNLNVTYYHTNTYNQTIYAPLSASTGYSNFIAQTGNIMNEGVEVTLGFSKNWAGFGWDSNISYTFNNNKILELAHGIPDPVTGESVDVTEIMKSDLGYGNVAPKVILREGGSLSDIYTNHRLVYDETGNLKLEETDYEYAGSLAAKGTFGWNNSFSYKGLALGFVISGRIGGKVYSATQGILDYYGASEASAAARDRGYVIFDGKQVDPEQYYKTVATSQGGHGAYYLYDATNIRLAEVSLQYSLPRKWFRYKAGLTLGVVARNLCMIYCTAPFDPELTGAAGSNYYQGVDYFMLPSTRNIGFNIKLTF